MTRKPAPSDAPRRRSAGRGLLAAALLAALALAGAARAAPVALDSDADLAAFAGKVSAFAGASRVDWVVAARTKEDAERIVAAVGAHLKPSDRFLLDRIRAEALASPGETGPRAWIAPEMDAAAPGPACSWQVWVSDPAFPSPLARPLSVPLAPNDRMPVSPAASLRIGHTSLLQTRVYAFDETRPGAIRDLSTAPDVNVPVAPEQGEDLIVLAMAREAAPFLESVKSALADSQGQRRALGPQYSLRGKLLGVGRGLGANIQQIPTEMIVPKAAVAPGQSRETSASDVGALMETCLYALTPAP